MQRVLKEYLTNRSINNRNKIITENMGLIYTHVRQIRGNYEEHELVNQLIPRMIRAIETFDSSKKIELSTWINQWLRHELIKWVKRDLRHRHLSLENIDISAPDEPDELPDINLVLNNQHLLNEQQRTILMLTLKGLNGVQIGQMLNWSKAYVSQIRKEIVAKLKPVVHCEG